MTLEPVTVATDQWTVVFAYPIGEIDSEVNALFKRAVIWAGFVALSITAVLVSTAVQTIRFQARLERERHQVLTRELTQARRIQEQWLPDIASAPPQLDVAALNLPASHISGDFYNWFELTDGRHVVVIGDVTGHGMAAAFLMATTQLLVHNTMARLGDPGPALAEVNRQLTSQVFHGQFVTMLILVLDFDHHSMEVASAGHPSPLIGENETVRKLDLESQLVLGVEKDVVYPTQRFELPELSSLFLFTDGVIDARGPNDERFGAARLISALSGHLGSAHEMVDAVANSVREFRRAQEPDDDLTLVAIQLRKSAALALEPSASLTLPSRS
jgi:sigma-B regulation protein RsbU (phosphoserine phosphatase)